MVLDQLVEHEGVTQEIQRAYLSKGLEPATRIWIHLNNPWPTSTVPFLRDFPKPQDLVSRSGVVGRLSAVPKLH